MSFTLDTQQLLIKTGYTHVILKRQIDPEDREINNGRLLLVYEALMPDDERLSNYLSEHINSEYIQKLIENAEADCFISINS